MHPQSTNRAPSIRTLASDEWRTYQNLRLRALADSPDAFARTLPEEQGRQDTEWSARLASGAGSRWDLPLVAEVDAEPLGLAWGRIDQTDPDVAYLYQMWVDPNFRRLGAGGMFLAAIVAWATAADARHLNLGVTCGTPAMRLYTCAGFKPVGKPKPIRPGSALLGQSMQLGLRGLAA